MELSNIAQILGIIITNAIAILMAFVNLNVKVTEARKDNLFLKADLEEHKQKNKEEIRELKDIIMRDKGDNKDDHRAIIVEVTALSKDLNSFRLEIIKAIQKK